MRPEHLRELDGERAEAPSGAVDQDPLSAPEIRLPQELQCLASPVGDGRRLFVPEVRGHRRDRTGLGALAQADVLRVGPQADARRREDTVALPERRHVPADRIHVAGKLLSEHAPSRPEEAEPQPHRQPDPGGEVKSPQLAVGRADRRGADSDQHLVALRYRLAHVPESKDTRRSVARADDRLHGSSGSRLPARRMVPFPPGTPAADRPSRWLGTVAGRSVELPVRDSRPPVRTLPQPPPPRQSRMAHGTRRAIRITRWGDARLPGRLMRPSSRIAVRVSRRPCRRGPCPPSPGMIAREPPRRPAGGSQ